MSIDLSFSIEPEFRNGEVFLIVHVAEKNSSRLLYLPTLKEFGKQEKDLSAFLIQEHCKESGILPLSSQSTTLICNKIRIKSSRSLETLQKIIASKRLLWKGRTLFFNPLSKISLFFEVESLEAGKIQVSGFLQMDGRIEKISSVDFLIPGESIWGICHQMVFILPKSIRKSWLDWVYPEPKQLEGKQKTRFIEEYYEDPPEDFPTIHWKGDFKKEEEKQVQNLVYPCLLLKDSGGAFANLSMDYGSFQVDFQDPRAFQGRDLAGEKAWEKDLLETDYRLKFLESSHYYCPMDKVASSLSFLLEIGWKVIDSRGRVVKHADGSSLELLSRPQGILVKGSFRYGDHEVDLKNVVGAFTRRDRFVEISSGVVGLLDASEKYEGIQDLTESEIAVEGCLMKPKKWGLLDSFLHKAHLGSDVESKRLLDRLKGINKAGEDLALEGFRGELRPYQKQGVEWLCFLHNNQLSGLLADEMGLGKTIQTLAFLSQVDSSLPILIVVPTSLTFNWKKEWNEFLLNKKLHSHEGSDRTSDPEVLKAQQAIITSYALLRIDSLLFQKLHYSCVVLDEAQWIKNPSSHLAKAVYELQANMKVCLTGTPIENRADDLWSLFHFLEPELLGDRKEFLASLSSAQLDRRHSERIRKLIRPFFLRRLKEEVAKDLPEKIEQVIWVEMKESQRTYYEEWLSKTRLGLLKKVRLEGASAHRMEILEAILRLRQICAHPGLVDSECSIEGISSKMERVLEDLEEVVEEGRKVLVYSQFTQMLHLLEKQIKIKGWKYAYLDGNTKDREAQVTNFQEDPSVQIFLISLKAGGVGLNLTAADYVFLFDPWWNEAVERQAIDRAHRFGRQGAVIARRYIMAESIEEKMMKIKEHKVSLAEGILNLDMEGGSIGVEEMIELLK